VTSSIANVRFEKTIKELIPFLAIMVIMLLALVFFPQIVLWMPDAVFGRK
jgi:TRAP-type C4-dicarboxylate transport system permease large subunit